MIPKSIVHFPTFLRRIVSLWNKSKDNVMSLYYYRGDFESRLLFPLYHPHTFLGHIPLIIA